MNGTLAVRCLFAMYLQSSVTGIVVLFQLSFGVVWTLQQDLRHKALKDGIHLTLVDAEASEAERASIMQLAPRLTTTKMRCPP